MERDVTKPYFQYKTNKPKKDGLFCEIIFEPIKGEICTRRKYRAMREKKRLKVL